MSDKPTPTTLDDLMLIASKPGDLRVAAPIFVPVSKQAVHSASETVNRLPTGELVASESSQIIPTTDDAQSTPTPASVSSFAELVKAAREASVADSAEVSMMSMTDDDSDISTADMSTAVEPKTPLLPLSESELGDLDVSPTGGLGGGVRCGLPKPAEPASEAKTRDRVLEGLVPQKADYDPRPRYRPFPPQRSCNIHVQNLPAHYGDAELSALCEEFGRIVSVRVFRRPVAAPPNRRLPDGQNSTYGFVLFDNVISAENCVNALRQRYKNIYPSFARQAAPAVHQPAFVGLLEAMAFGDLHQTDSNLNAQAYGQDLNLGQTPYPSQGLAGPIFVPAYDMPVAYEALSTVPAPAYVPAPAPTPAAEATHATFVPASVESSAGQNRPRALTIKPMPPPIQSFAKSNSTNDGFDMSSHESPTLLIVDGLPKDFGLLDTLFAPHTIHDVRLHRKGPSDGVRGSVRVPTRLAALQSIEKLSGMQFGASAGGLRVRIAEEVYSDDNDVGIDGIPSLPSYRTLPDIQDAQTLLVPRNTTDGPLSSSISAPAVASMIGSGLNQLLFASDSNESFTSGVQRISSLNQLSPSNGRLLASSGHLAVPFTPAMVSSISMPHVGPRFLNPSPSYDLLPSLRVGNVNLPITNLFPSSNSLSNRASSTSVGLKGMLASSQPVPEPPVIKVSSYASAAKKAAVHPSSREDQKTKKRKSRRPNKSGRDESEKDSPEFESKPTLDEKGPEREAKDKPAPPITDPLADKTVSTFPKQSKSISSKGRKWSSARRRSNVKPVAAAAV